MILIIPARDWLFLGPITALGIADTVRTDFTNWSWHFPHLAFAWWTIIFLCAYIGCIFEASYRHQSETERREKSAVLSEEVKGGGRGGSVEVRGNRGIGVGGPGGTGGVGGNGGDGGSGRAIGDDATVMGGAGGNMGTPDGRGGKIVLSSAYGSSLSTSMWGTGHGSAGRNTSEYDRRLKILSGITHHYIEIFPEIRPYIVAGVERVPVDFTNKRLEELGEAWKIRRELDEIIME